MECSQDLNSPGHIACKIDHIITEDLTKQTLTCGNWDAATATDMTDESTRTAMTHMEVMLDDNGLMVGMKYCEIPVNSGISWSQYLEWLFQKHP